MKWMKDERDALWTENEKIKSELTHRERKTAEAADGHNEE